MEILRFEEASTTAPKRKKSSKGYLTAGFVAALFGIGTALASATTTIEINNDQGISLGQGVTLATACDTEIGVVPITEMEVTGGEPIFYLTELQINDIDTELTTPADPAATPPVLAKSGCGDKYFDIQIFNPVTNLPYTCAQLSPTSTFTVSPGAISCVNDLDDNKLTFQVVKSADESVDYKIEFVKAPSSISYITLVSRNS
jgi:hypothetical protein